MAKSLGNQTAPQEGIKQYGADILRLWVMQVDYTEDQRIGPEILKSVADSYRRLRNTFRFLLGALDGFSNAERMPVSEMPELERLMLHRLAELDGVVRQGYRDFEYQKTFQTLFQFATVDLSAFYFDIRKDALYCDAPESARRRACRTVLDLLFQRLTIWLAPMLCFTMEEVWLTRFGQGDASVHLETIPDTPGEWHDEALSQKWSVIRQVRRVVTGALEERRRDKTIGASLEAAPTVYVSDESMAEAARSVTFEDVCITSGIVIETGEGPADAFRLEDVAGVSVIFAGAAGEKCARCWKILPDVGNHAAPQTCARCAAVVG